ncbi:uncharacterized protein [Euphorbia lathyris]|uniref:uncharacterized protein n=1 Tax=Euphorbia lathyris TaxID=212925 RepID=UPI0033137E4E
MKKMARVRILVWNQCPTVNILRVATKFLLGKLLELNQGIVIKLLIERVSLHLKKSMLDFCLSWYIDEKRRVQSTGAQAMSLLVEAMNKKFKNQSTLYCQQAKPFCKWLPMLPLIGKLTLLGFVSLLLTA